MAVVHGVGWLFLVGACALATWESYRFHTAANDRLFLTLSDLLEAADLRLPHWIGDVSVAQVVLELPALPYLAVSGVVCFAVSKYFRRSSLAAPEPPSLEAAATAGRRASASRPAELKQALRSCRSAFLAVAGFSGVLNALMLTGSIFMLEIYDRVLPSRSLPTLVGLCLIAAVLFLAQGLLDVIRGRLLVRIGTALDEALSGRTFDVLVRSPIRLGGSGDGVQPLRDLDAVRSFLSGLGPTALFDLPWMPFYLAIIFAFHPLLGMTALVGAIALISLTLLTEGLVRRPTREMALHVANRMSLAEASVRNAEVLAGMGFAGRLRNLWQQTNGDALGAQRRTSDIGGGLGAIARASRTALQSAVLAVGALLVIRQEASGGIIIAGSILAARALAPVDIAIAHWRGFVAARQSWRRLDSLLAALPSPAAPEGLPRPVATFNALKVVAVPPGQQRIVVRDVSFDLAAGQALGIVGHSGSGKSTLARVLVGAWLPIGGSVRLDGATLDQWPAEVIGKYIGYLPQGVELFAGTVAQNIARFDPDADMDAVIAAAKSADIHELIVNLPKGYNTEIGDRGSALSAGQRQRVALARALYGEPFLLVLDEPDASLDQEGELALQKAIMGVRSRGGIVVVVSHRQSIVAAVDQLLAMQHGQVLAYGPKELVMHKIARPAPGTVHVLKSIP